ncbi:nitroreductase [Clostridium felsineum]|uniref:nitroreductase family protein n=1 Tax=Clostridium felsineum TaxID=36839 RepID=UPI00214D2ACB|nr:nitroreductase [Clostridium felsineum]MCR3761329.1 nitroreductase [Clostridium felsineum]
MNETLKNILSRRSIRKFKQEQIKDEELQSIIEAAKYAPSAMNQQSWHFTVVQNKEVLSKIVDSIKLAYKNLGEPKPENFNPFYDSPTLIIVTGDEKAIAPQNDGSLAIGNILLAAHSLGIGSCWIHILNFIFNRDEFKDLKRELGIPEGYVSVAAVALGYKDMEGKAAPRKEGTVNIIK